MPIIEHVNYTDPNIHEPKGISLAANGSLYVANGLGSGSWSNPHKQYINIISHSVPYTVLNFKGDTTHKYYCPISGTLKKVYIDINNVISIVLDFTIVIYINGVELLLDQTINTNGNSPITYIATPILDTTLFAGDLISFVGTQSTPPFGGGSYPNRYINLEIKFEIQ